MNETLTRLYREAMRRRDGDGCVDPELLQALAEDRLDATARQAALQQLGDGPAAESLLAFARESAQASAQLAWDIRRADAVSRSRQRPRRRRAWLAAAAAALLAVAVLPLLPDAGHQGSADPLVDQVALDGDSILAASFENGRVSHSPGDGASGPAGASIFSSRFDG